MNNEQDSIHDFDFNLICEYYSSVDRQGPGSPEITLRALSFIKGLTAESKIADLGCGTGTHTITLARNSPGHITALDLFPKFIDILNENVARAGLGDRIKGIVGDMGEPPFADGELDLIWSEGAIYNIGFERGINEWRRFLKTGGYLAVSEVSWFTPGRPAEINDFWMDAYPGIDTVSAKIDLMQKAGYAPEAMFVLPVECWTEHFYAPQERSRREFLTRYSGNPAAEMLVRNQVHEEGLYNKYKDYYGYVFYVGKKVEL